MAKTTKKQAAPKTKYQTCEIQRVNRSAMKFMPGNAQSMTESEKTRLKKSIEDGDVGLVDTPTWNKRSGHVVGGHHRIQCIDEIEGHETYDLDVAVIDVDEPTERAINLMLNNPRNRGTYDPAKLAEFLAGIPDSHAHQTGFSDADREWLLGNQVERKDKTPRIDDAIWGSLAEVKAVDVEEAEEDLTPEVEELVFTQPGDVWTLGNHRLICGDSTVKADVDAVLQGELPFMMVTDPPYGVTYDPKWRLEAGVNKEHQTRAEGKVTNDDRASWKEAWDLFPGTVAYVWHGALHSTTVGMDMIASKFDLRAQIIWVKPSLVIGRGAYHWRHEPCAPPGSGVLTPNGEVPIESLRDGDRVVSYSPYESVVRRRGRKVKVAKRHYVGEMYNVSVARGQTKCTDGHQWTVRFNRKAEGRYVTYLMQKDNRFRVGVSRLFNSRGFGVGVRMKDEGADAAWIIGVHDTKEEAEAYELGLSCRYAIPTCVWNHERCSGQKRGPDWQDIVYGILSGADVAGAAKMLADHGRSLRFPLITSGHERGSFSRKTTVQVTATNVIPEIMQIPVPTRGDKFSWETITAVFSTPYDGEVYSLDVAKDQHYVQDGLITHNCWYGSRGTAKWSGDRKQSTAWEIANMHRTQGNVDDGKTIHGTQKPVECMARPIRNHGDESDHVYDPFLGSGTTLIACEQMGRRCFGVEIAPEYCDLIVRRWQNLTGEEAVRADGETLATLEAAGAGYTLTKPTPDAESPSGLAEAEGEES